MRTALLLYVCSICCALLALLTPPTCRAADPVTEGVSSRDARLTAARSIPYQRLTPQTGQLVRDVVENPSYFRRMPPQQIECNPDMFTFLVRRPEVMVSIWELMGITQVSTRRTSPLTFVADDGVGTTAKCDLIYGDERLHIYYGVGNYDGKMSPRKMTGRCVCILQSQPGTNEHGESIVAGTMDVFLKLDNLGADLLTRTLGSLVSKTADYNFVETAKFMSQISQICIYNPAAAQGLATQLTNIEGSVRQEFAAIAAKIATEQMDDYEQLVPSVRRSSLPEATATRPYTAPDATEPIQLTLQDSGGAIPDETMEFGQHSRKVIPKAIVAVSPTANMANTTLDESSSMANRNTQQLNTSTPNSIAPRKDNVYMRR